MCVCSTRRSRIKQIHRCHPAAGVPFIVQSPVVGEHQAPPAWRAVVEGFDGRMRQREQDEATTIAGESGNAGRTFLFPFARLSPARVAPGWWGSRHGSLGRVRMMCILSRTIPGSLDTTKNPKVFTFGVNVAMASQTSGEAALARRPSEPDGLDA